jgi:hypothetical protein
MDPAHFSERIGLGVFLLVVIAMAILLWSVGDEILRRSRTERTVDAPVKEDVRSPEEPAPDERQAEGDEMKRSGMIGHSSGD